MKDKNDKNEKQVTLWGGNKWEGKNKRLKKVNMIDILPIQE
jgi:hypothetical protein